VNILEAGTPLLKEEEGEKWEETLVVGLVCMYVCSILGWRVERVSKWVGQFKGSENGKWVVYKERGRVRPTYKSLQHVFLIFGWLAG
jgi:hypothetical protein